VKMVALQYLVDFRTGEEVAGWGTGWKMGELHLSHNEAEDLIMEDIGVFEFDSWGRCVQARKLFIECLNSEQCCSDFGHIA
jgi:hypothetical protein